MKTRTILRILFIWVLATMAAFAQPRITNQPPWLHVCRGSTATFSVGAEGTPPLNYQWYSGGTPSPAALLVGETNVTLMVTSVTASRSYVVVITNFEGSVTSAQARAYLDTPFGITQQPVDATLETGSTFTLSVTVTSQVAPSVQWYFNGQPLSGATASTLTVANVQSTNAGNYWLQISNACNCDTSRVATLEVADAGATFSKITEGPVATDMVRTGNGLWADYDEDGLLDLVVIGDVNPGTNTQFYHNDGNGRFSRLTNGPTYNATDAVIYALWADIENDGDLDFFVFAAGETFIYRNQGGQFTREPAPMDVPVQGTSISWADYDGDGFLDAALGSWVGLVPNGSSLLHNKGDGTFTVVMDQPMCLTTSGDETSCWVDYDNDGDLDLFAARPGGTEPSRIYRNDGNGQFVEDTPEPLRSELYRRLGGAWADFDNDGDLDLFTPARSTNASGFYVNQGSGTFVRWGGLPTTLTNNATSRHAAWGDYDNDGLLDLFVASGPNLLCRLFRNLGNGNFVEIKSVLPLNELGGHGPTWGDFDNDGFLDLHIGTWSTPPNRLYRNDGNTNHWLKVRLKGTRSNSHAVGARVFATANIGGKTIRQMRQIAAQTVFHDLEAHFGLGDATKVDVVRVEWPSSRTNRVTEWHNLAAGQILTLTEPINDLPGIVTQPADQTALIGSDVTLCVTASGAPPFSYQWRDYTTSTAFTEIPGATNSCLTFTNMQPTGHRFRVVISNPWGSVTSRLVQVVIKTPPYFTVQPTDQVVGLGENYTNKVVALGDAPLYYQWYFVSGVVTNRVAGQASSWLYLSNVQFTNAGEYFVVVTNTVGLATSTNADLRVVTRPPSILVQPATATVEVGLTYTNQVVAIGTAPLSYQWFFNELPLVGKTNSTITIPNIQTTNGGCYSVVITNSYGAVTSSCAVLFVGPGATFTRITGAPWDTDLGACWTGVVGDYDNDGDLDLFMSRYLSGRGALYQNNGDGTFRSITDSMFPLPVGNYNFGPCSDFDNDGRVDLFVIEWAGPTTGGPSSIYYNNGDGTFTPVSMDAPVNPWWMNAVDYDRDGLLDLYLTSIGVSFTNRLYRNVDGRAFQAKTSAEVGPILGMGLWSFGNAAWADYDDDGWEDVLTRNGSSATCLLFRNTRTGQFVADTNAGSLTSVGGGIVASWGDCDNDGRLDLAVGNTQGRSGVYRNLGGGNFQRAALTVGSTSFYNGVAWGDYDNDGFLDLIMTYGNNRGNSLFRNNGDGTFYALSLGPVVNDRVSTGGSYAGVWFDYDNDGFLDLFVPNGNDPGTAVVPNFLYHNGGNSNAWLKVKLVGTASNRDAAGTKVRVKARFGGSTWWQRRDITSGGDPYGGSGPLAHFGLRDATIVDTLRVEWPSGRVTESNNVPVRQTITLTEPPGMTPAKISNGVVQFDLIGHTGQVFDVMTSSDVAAPATGWSPWVRVTNTSRTMTVTDPSPNTLQRFYKAMPAK